MTEYRSTILPEIDFSAEDAFTVEAKARQMQHAYLGRAIRTGAIRLYRAIREAVAHHREVTARRRAYEHLFRHDDRLLEDIGLTRGLLGDWVKTGVRAIEPANDENNWGRARRFVTADSPRYRQAA